MKTSKRAKCGIHSLSFCNTKHDAPQCDNCLLVRHHKRYIYQNGYKLKRCPHCGEYKRLTEYKVNSKGYTSWCYDCFKSYARARHRLSLLPSVIPNTYKVIYTTLTEIDDKMKSFRDVAIMDKQQITTLLLTENVKRITIIKL